jgi:hypothetical protein
MKRTTMDIGSTTEAGRQAAAAVSRPGIRPGAFSA